MKRQRVYADRPQTISMKLQIANNYIDKIAPHQLMIQAINLQNKQIYTLQEKYLKLLQETKHSKQPSQYTQSQLKTIKTHQQMKINQRKKFVQQGLKANQKKQKQQFQRQKASLLQVLSNKQHMLKDMKGHKMNVFFNMEENILDELIDYAAKSEKIQQDKRSEFIEEIKWWKKRLEINEKDTKN